MSKEMNMDYEETLQEADQTAEEEFDESCDFITLRTEDGEELKFEFLDTVTLDDREFVVLLPLEEDAEEVIVLEVEDALDDPDSEDYTTVEDQEILDKVFEVFKKRHEDEFNFVDE